VTRRVSGEYKRVVRAISKQNQQTSKLLSEHHNLRRRKQLVLKNQNMHF
jgi:hypothetical protein